MSNSYSENARNEQRALVFSLYGVVFFVVLALGFALLTGSDAILFDGIYSMIAFCMALLTLKVAKLAERPDDEQFHFGYTSIEPTLNLFKSLIVIVSCSFAAVEALKRLLAGGNPAEYGWAVVYGAIATVGCFLVAWLMKRASENYSSDLVRVESKTWFIDGLLSGSVLLGFIGAWWLEQSPWSEYAPLIDPILLIALVLMALPIPAKIMIDSFKEVISMAPQEHIVDDIERRLLESLQQVSVDHVEFRVSKRGRNTYVLVHVVVADDFGIQSISQLDDIRNSSEQHLKNWNPEIVMDMLFVKDPQLAV
ncbi:MAG: cation diffusion facilitator family transporter [Pseudomonadales bacterium]